MDATVPSKAQGSLGSGNLGLKGGKEGGGGEEVEEQVKENLGAGLSAFICVKNFFVPHLHFFFIKQYFQSTMHILNLPY